MAEMRNIAAEVLMRQMEVDERIVVLDADLAKANGIFGIKERFPRRFFDVGIAEANMAGMAAGLAAYGFKPVICSFCPFVTRKIGDQIAVSIAYPGLDVKIIGTDPGITAQLNGATHLSVEDVGVMRSIPNMLIFEPADCAQYEKALPLLLEFRGPVYIRQLRKLEVRECFGGVDYDFQLFSVDILRRGRDVTLFCSGIEVEQAMLAAERLSGESVEAEVVNVHTIKPADTEGIVLSVGKTGCAVVCENHNIFGGLGSAVAEILAENCPVPLEFIGIRDRFGEVGKMPYLIKKFQMDDISITEAAKRVLKKKKSLGQRKSMETAK